MYNSTCCKKEGNSTLSVPTRKGEKRRGIPNPKFYFITSKLINLLHNICCII